MRKLILIFFLFSFSSLEAQPLKKLLRKQASAPSPPAGAILWDLFEGANGTSLASHTMNLGSGWTISNDGLTCLVPIDVKIQSNQAVSDVGLYSIAWAEASDADVIASVDLVIPNSSNYLQGLIFRYVDCANYWIVVIQRDAGGTTYMGIYRVTSGTLNVAATVNVTGATNSTVGIQVTLSGSSIIALASTSETCNTTDATHASATKFGLFGYRDGTYSSVPDDNFLVKN